MATKYHIPINPNPEHYQLVGELAVRWGWIENQTGVIIRELLRIRRPEGHMAIGNMGIQPKTRVLASLAKHAFRKNAIGKQLEKLADDIQGFDKFRNDVIHGLWVHAPRGTNNLALLRRKNLQQQVEPLPDRDALTQLTPKLSKLREIQNDAQRLTHELKTLRGKFE